MSRPFSHTSRFCTAAVHSIHCYRHPYIAPFKRDPYHLQFYRKNTWHRHKWHSIFRFKSRKMPRYLYEIITSIQITVPYHIYTIIKPRGLLLLCNAGYPFHDESRFAQNAQNLLVFSSKISTFLIFVRINIHIHSDQPRVFFWYFINEWIYTQILPVIAYHIEWLFCMQFLEFIVRTNTDACKLICK